MHNCAFRAAECNAGRYLCWRTYGRLLAYSAVDGSVLWKDETDRSFETANNVEAKGGSIDGAGVVIANGMVIVNSGYDKFGEIPGNVLLVYRPKRGAK